MFAMYNAGGRQERFYTDAYRDLETVGSFSGTGKLDRIRSFFFLTATERKIRYIPQPPENSANYQFWKLEAAMKVFPSNFSDGHFRNLVKYFH